MNNIKNLEDLLRGTLADLVIVKVWFFHRSLHADERHCDDFFIIPKEDVAAVVPSFGMVTGKELVKVTTSELSVQSLHWTITKSLSPESLCPGLGCIHEGNCSTVIFDKYPQTSRPHRR